MPLTLVPTLHCRVSIILYRYELYCVVVLCYLLAPDAVVDIASDSELTVVGVARRQQGGGNYDIWALLWQVVEAKRLTMRARWVKAHGDEHPEYFSGMPSLAATALATALRKSWPLQQRRRPRFRMKRRYRYCR